MRKTDINSSVAPSLPFPHLFSLFLFLSLFSLFLSFSSSYALAGRVTCCTRGLKQPFPSSSFLLSVSLHFLFLSLSDCTLPLSCSYNPLPPSFLLPCCSFARLLHQGKRGSTSPGADDSDAPASDAAHATTAPHSPRTTSPSSTAAAAAAPAAPAAGAAAHPPVLRSPKNRGAKAEARRVHKRLSAGAIPLGDAEGHVLAATAASAAFGLTGVLQVAVLGAQGLTGQQQSGALHCDPYCVCRALPPGASKVRAKEREREREMRRWGRERLRERKRGKRPRERESLCVNYRETETEIRAREPERRRRRQTDTDMFPHSSTLELALSLTSLTLSHPFHP